MRFSILGVALFTCSAASLLLAQRDPVLKQMRLIIDLPRIGSLTESGAGGYTSFQSRMRTGTGLRATSLRS